MKEVKEFLVSNQDKNYLKFSDGLGTKTNKKKLGVRIPIIRKYAKDLSKKYSLEYLIKNIDEEYYEEILLKGFIIGSYKLTYSELINYIDYFLPKITDWSICDTFVAGLKITKKYRDNLWNYLTKKIETSKEFYVRFSLVMMLNYYITDDYQKRIYDVIKSINIDKYYVKMANAWLISYMFINYYHDTFKFVENNNLDNWTVKKGISKTIESFRVSNEQKNELKELRNKLK